MEPASIRYKNPGAMWGRTGTRISDTKEVETNAPIPLKWGSKTTFYLSDGKGQGNNIAVFDTYVQGICAQLDLWRNSTHYKNKTFEDAITIWSGHNEVESYIALVLKRVPGMTRKTIMNDDFWSSTKGVEFLKAQASHEAGKQYPALDGDFIEAQSTVFKLQPVGGTKMTPNDNDPLWLTNARKLVGLKEIVGSRHEPEVVEFFAEAGHPEIHDDETAWCAAFANAMLRRAGYAGTGSLAARSFLTWGEALSEPKLGCITVFKRGNSTYQGHVAFFLRDLGNSVEILGGNQGNAVSVITKSKDDLLGYRWPVVTAAPITQKVATGKETAKAAGGVAVGTGIAAGAKAAVDAGWGVMEWSLLACAIIILAGVIFFGWRWWKARRTQTIAKPASVPSLMDGVKRKAITPRHKVVMKKKIDARKKTTKRKAK